jgi:hypothetical protein
VSSLAAANRSAPPDLCRLTNFSLLTFKILEKPTDKRLDLSCLEETQIRLVWRYEAPGCKGDLRVYLRQQYRTQPDFQYADILLLTPTKVILSFKSSQILQEFSYLRLNGSILGVPSGPCEPWSPTSELLYRYSQSTSRYSGGMVFLLRDQCERSMPWYDPNTSSANMSRPSLIPDFTRNLKVGMTHLQVRSAISYI